MKRIFFALAGLAVAVSAVAGKAPALKIYKGERRTDTVFTPRFYVIGITDPGATASVGGDECHVYRTGSFGAEVALKPGRNTIAVEVKADGRSTRESVEVVYVERKEASVAVAGDFSTPTMARLAAPVTVVTKEGAFLQHGNGTDRLGGSKMNFIPAGIPLKAVAENSQLYAVMLGADDMAFVPKYAVEADSSVTVPAEAVNTGSISVINTGKSDRVVVNLPVRLPFYSRSEIDPSTILITLYGATNNTNWLTQRNVPGMIDYVDLRRDGADQLTLVIRLKEKYAWGYSVKYEGDNLVIDVRHCPESLDVKDLTIGLDAGHGGEYLGAVSPSGFTEKEVNLDIVLKAAAMLREMGADVVLTRDGDTGPSMGERKQIWLDGNVDIAISVHNNSSGNPLVRMGTSAYYKHIANRGLAQALHNQMLDMGLENFGLTGNFNFSLNQPTEYPNALVEVLFMSSLPEEELLADPEYRTELARNIVKGLLNYLEQVKASRK